jgi:archaellum component FlaC
MSSEIEYEKQLQDENEKLREILAGILNEIDEKKKRVEDYKKKYGELSKSINGWSPTFEISSAE